jgi:Rrf2 family protein
MTSLKFATAVHTLLLLAHARADAPERAMSSRDLANSIEANAVVVRRILAALAAGGLVATRAGAGGGAWLIAKPQDIHLDAVFAAVEEPAGIGFRAEGNPACPVGRAAPGVIRALLAEMQQASAAALEKRTLADLLEQIAP